MLKWEEESEADWRTEGDKSRIVIMLSQCQVDTRMSTIERSCWTGNEFLMDFSFRNPTIKVILHVAPFMSCHRCQEHTTASHSFSLNTQYVLKAMQLFFPQNSYSSRSLACTDFISFSCCHCLLLPCCKQNVFSINFLLIRMWVQDLWDYEIWHAQNPIAWEI